MFAGIAGHHGPIQVRDQTQPVQWPSIQGSHRVHEFAVECEPELWFVRAQKWHGASSLDKHLVEGLQGDLAGKLAFFGVEAQVWHIELGKKTRREMGIGGMLVEVKFSEQRFTKIGQCVRHILKIFRN